MSFDPNRPIEVYVCYAHERGRSPRHWLLSLKSRGDPSCTWIHSTGGPSQRKEYRYTVQANKPFQSHGIASSDLIGTVSPRDVNKVLAAAKRTQPQQCQMYVVSVVAELEKRGLLPRGRTAYLEGRVQI